MSQGDLRVTGRECMLAGVEVSAREPVAFVDGLDELDRSTDSHQREEMLTAGSGEIGLTPVEANPELCGGGGSVRPHFLQQTMRTD